MKRKILSKKVNKTSKSIKYGKLVSVMFLFVVFSCKGKFNFSKQKTQDEKIVVEYKDHFLTDRDIRLILPKDISPEDSTKLVKAYIEEWVKKKALVDKAEENIDELTLKEIENRIVEYRQDLLINGYNNFLIDKFVKDSIDEAELEAYYEKHKHSFPLTKEIIQYQYVSVPKSMESKAERLFNSGKDEDFDELMKIVLTAGTPYHEKDSLWYTVDMLQAQVPEINQADYLSQLRNRRRIKISSDTIVTMIRIINLKRKGSVSPYEFVKPTIKNLLLNKRKLNLLSDLQNELYKEALNNNEIKIKNVK